MRIEGLPIIVNKETNKVRRAEHPQSTENPISPQKRGEIEKFIAAHRKNLIFSFDKKANRVVVTIKNGETIQIPDERTLNLTVALKEVAKRYQRDKRTDH